MSEFGLKKKKALKTCGVLSKKKLLETLIVILIFSLNTHEDREKDETFLIVGNSCQPHARIWEEPYWG